jgi:hypothetical protein
MILKDNLYQMCEYIFELTTTNLKKIDTDYPPGTLQESPHIVDCVYKILCGKNLKRQPEGTTITIKLAFKSKKKRECWMQWVIVNVVYPCQL